MSPALQLDTARVTALASRLRRFVATNAALLEARIAGGRVVDSHGDLRPEHVFLTPEPQVIDCLEFSAELRLQDTAAEAAFLALECERLDFAPLGARVLELYRNECRDDVSPELLAFYRARQALIRGRDRRLAPRSRAAGGRREPLARARPLVSRRRARRLLGDLPVEQQPLDERHRALRRARAPPWRSRSDHVWRRSATTGL